MKPVLLLLSFTLAHTSSAGTLRDRIKERLRERRENKESGTKNAELNGPGDFSLTLEHGGMTRLFKVHIPSSYKKDSPMPLLVALHGGGGNMNYQSTEKYYHQISKSDEAGFIVVFPNGFSRFNGKFATWNAGKCCGKGRDTNSDDVGFIKSMIEKISSDLSVDKKKIFITGMSNGGMMSYRLACEMTDMIAGIAAVAGTDNTITCSPKKPISILHIHAKDDDHVLFNGGAGPNAFKDEKAVSDFTSVPATVEKWVIFNGCDKKPKRILEKNGAYCDLYSGCKENVHVQLCVTETGGHSWPGGSKIRETKGSPPSTAISANDVMWDFFKL